MCHRHAFASRLPAFSRALALLSLATACLIASAARAQQRFDAEAFEPAIEQESSVLNVYGARTLAPGDYSLNLLVSYGRHPLSIESRSSGNGLGDLVGAIGTLSLMGGVGLWDRVDIGIAVPVHRVAAGTDFRLPPPAVQAALVDESKVALGDVRLVPRVSLLTRRADSGMGLALLVPVSLPTGDDDVYVGESLRVEPRIAIDWAAGPLLLAANVGYQIRESARLLGSKVDDMLRWGVGADIRVIKVLSVLLETSGGLGVHSDDFGKSDAPTEALLGLRYRRSGWLAQIGGGPGIVRGITTPQYRLFAGIGYSPEPKSPPPPPLPDPDRDHDGVLDTSDACVALPEDRDSFQDDDGCPDEDNDQDGVLDTSDACASEPEDKDGFKDEDGCPDPDNDGDGVADADDKCPNEAGDASHAGCAAPPEPPPSANVTIAGEQIELKQVILFERERATIDPQSNPLLDELASVLKAHPELTRILVEGHTDSIGDRNYNVQLSAKRANAVVKALVERGVAAERLRAEGIGPDRPLLPNDTRPNRIKNRRVELHIEQRAPAP